MIRTILKNATARIIVGLVAIGLWLTGPALVENGRLTDLACYIILGAGVLLMMWLVFIDRQVNAGRIAEDSLPVWLRN